MRGQRGRLPLLTLVLALCVGVLAGWPARCVATIWNDHAYAEGRCYASSATWRGAEANIEVRNGAISDADASNGGFILETLWVLSTPNTGWVECGYMRGYRGQNIRTPYWYCQTLAGNGYWHRVVNITLTNGESPKFRIAKTSADNAWQCTIGGVAAQDSTGDSVANNCLGSHINRYEAGLECCASSGRLGTTSDPVDITNQKKKSVDGVWGFSSAGLPYILGGDPQGITYGWWVTTSQSSSNYRND